MRNAAGAKSALQSRDNLVVSGKLGKAHRSARAFRHQQAPYRVHHFGGNFFRPAHGVARRIETLNRGPGTSARKHIVHFGGVFQMPQVDLLDVVLGGGVAALGLAGDQRLRFARRDAEIEDQVFARQTVDGILEMFNPSNKFRALLSGSSGDLMRKIGTDIAIHEDHFAFVQRRLELRFGLEAVAGIQ